MADMAQISQIAKTILQELKQVSLAIEAGLHLEHFEKAKGIMSVISSINFSNLSNLEQLIGQISQIISKAPEKVEINEKVGHDENFYKVMTHQNSCKVAQQSQSRGEWVEELSNSCWIFVQKIDNLFKHHIVSLHPQDQKQNRDQNEAFDEQTCHLILKMLTEFKKIISQINIGEEINDRKEESQTGKMHCESEGGKKHDNSQSNSSCRSLLTEKLKKIATVDNDEENGVFCVEDKIVIKGNWVLREMKGHKNEKGSQPRQIHSFEQESYEANIRSMGMPIANRRVHKTELPMRRGILEQIHPFAQSKREKKPKKDESSCARCDIY